jgi:uncharacterized membrane protein YccF (DUF307 family)
MTNTQTVVVERSGPPLILRILWFLLVGWWLSQVAIIAGWVLNLTIIGLPLGIWVLNRIPVVATLKGSKHAYAVSTDAAGTVNLAVSMPQRSFVVRALWFILIGWWASFFWLEAAWLLSLTIIGIPLAFWMFGASGKVLTLKR